MKGIQVDLRVLKKLMAQKMPKLTEVFSRYNVDITIPCTQWFLTLYVKTLPIEACIRVWDVMFLEGHKVLFRAAIALFKLMNRSS
eukprot:TRINITY_DN7640_c0_g1_i1.p1 TRINITY_DN7640_c0_g1~~TRINITY_DN7640_c0_g1_i1.p1  ORF type:complete len:85 (-),score=5.70 TRINITY_DN7640_c0_g1_i1:322-576(-)